MSYPKRRQPGSLTPGEASTAWEAFPLNKFGLDSLYTAIKVVVPDAPRDAHELERLVNEGKVKVAGVLWADELCYLVAWLGLNDQPSELVLQAAYRKAVSALANLPRYQALRDFNSTPTRGRA